MLTRFRVNGFKNLVGTDIRFGPFTCIAGANGVGKSNLFDAIRFLSALSQGSLLEAAREVRGGRIADVRSLFHRVGDTYDDTMSFDAEMIVPRVGEDALGQQAEATATFLRYSLELAYRISDGGLEIRREQLTHISKGDAKREIAFQHSDEWRDSVVMNRRTVPFISTQWDPSGDATIYLHLDRGREGSGKPSPRLARTLPRTVLNAANAAENRTAVLALREMQSWRLLRLEPSALREPDEFNAPTRLGENGAHLPALLARLASAEGQQIYAAAANRLSELIADVRDVGIERDEKRELLTLWAKSDDGTPHNARALSEGTLRFLALTAIELDPQSQGILCLEEPENGIHPERIPAMINLLQDIAVDPNRTVGNDNPLRQVVINTHSPGVVAQVEDIDLVAADLEERVANGQRFKAVTFRALPSTWRSIGVEDRNLMRRDNLMVYLNPFEPAIDEPDDYYSEHSNISPTRGRRQAKSRRVIDRPEVQQMAFRFANAK